MTTDDFKFIRFMNVETSRFSFWVIFQDLRRNSYGIKGRKELVRYFTDILGPLGESWQYEKNDRDFIIKLNENANTTMFTLKYCKV